MLTVEKIGGSSMSALKDVIDNIITYNNQLTGRVFVVSAFSGVTNLLLENKKNKAPGVYHRLANGEDFRPALAEVTAHLKGLNAHYGVPQADEFVEELVAGSSLFK